jgi:hypothetical protein
MMNKVRTAQISDDRFADLVAAGIERKQRTLNINLSGHERSEAKVGVRRVGL